ncbi:hypothetical protein, partial [Pseudomonas sp. P1.31]|uniref:hypothetical protein n=1 Tax=Pseudomonas sp. P1.31 TaxID=1699311 RepID=UPI001C44651A
SAAPTQIHVGAAEGCDLLLLLSKHFQKAKKSHRRGWLKGKTDKERKPVRVEAGRAAGAIPIN